MSTTHHYCGITGLGVITPVGIGIHQFTNALKNGRTNFSLLEIEHNSQIFRYPAGLVNDFVFYDQINELHLPAKILDKARRLRNISASTAFGVWCALEAWADSGLNENSTNLSRVAIISGGSNTQQAALQSVYSKNPQFINPNHSLNFFDTDIVGVLSELLGIRGEGYSLGAASASGNMALIQGHRLLDLGQYDAVLVVAPLMDISAYEYQAFTTAGAMANSNVSPELACRPFDVDHNGFVYGQSAGCIIMESNTSAAKRGKDTYGWLAGYGTCLDANRNPNPSPEGEKKAMIQAMEHASIGPDKVDYVNTHGTASISGDQAEVEALLLAGLQNVKANSTKSIVGHGLTAAGLVEAIASTIQMNEGFLHPTLNLANPITPLIKWVTSKESAKLNFAMNNSFGFGGVNTSIIICRNDIG